MDDWDTVTKIGSRARGGGAARETVVRGKSALNAAQRSGAIIGTEKKFTAGNATTKPGVDGQRLAKVDREDGITKPATVGDAVAKAIRDRRQQMVPKLTQVELGRKAGVIESIVKDFERGTAAPDQTNIRKLEKALEIHLQGSNIGTPKPLFRGPKK